MLVSHQHRFIYTKTVKTGGTSVESYFERFCMPAGRWQQTHQREEHQSPQGIVGYRGTDQPGTRRWWNHMPARQIRDQLGDQTWNEYFKFCVVRNPFEKCISAFEHLGSEHRISGLAGLAFTSATPGMSSEQRRFLHFLEHFVPVDRDKYTIDGQFCMDDVIRYERLEADVERICARLSLPFEPQYLPQFKRGTRRPEATVPQLYTLQARRLVEHAFAMELEYFGYEFTSQDHPPEEIIRCA